MRPELALNLVLVLLGIATLIFYLCAQSATRRARDLKLELIEADAVRKAALHYVGRELERYDRCCLPPDLLCTAHRILATNKLPGEDTDPPQNLQQEQWGQP